MHFELESDILWVMKLQKDPPQIAILTTFPNRTAARDGKGYSAIGWHSKKMIDALSKKLALRVYAEKLTNKNCVDDKMLNFELKRVWEKGSPLSLLKVFGDIWKSAQINTIYIQFEFNVFGGMKSNMILPFLFLISKFFGKRVVLELHQVVNNFTAISPHLGMNKKISQLFFGTGLKIYYYLMIASSSHIIVFEKSLQNKLSSFFVSKNKVSISHLFTSTNHNRKYKIKRSKRFQVLIFGYLNWYKGVDWAAEAFAKYGRVTDNIQLLIAGGANPYHENKLYYHKFLAHMKSISGKNANISQIGFVKEENVLSTFQKCDLVILPYRVFFSASGPFSLALTTHTPVILSEKLLPYCENPDFLQAMNESDIKKNQLFFPLDMKRFYLKILLIKNDRNELEKLVQFSKNLFQKRIADILIDDYVSILLPLKNKGLIAKFNDLKTNWQITS